MMRRIHLRMARAALGWTLRELAEKAGVNMNTISRYEAGFEILTGTAQKVEDVLRREGVVFIEEDEDFEPSIRIRKRKAIERPSYEPFRIAEINSPEIPDFRIPPRTSKRKPKPSRKRKG
jgi:transcriptional regulator with XRE-family HTH domain